MAEMHIRNAIEIDGSGFFPSIAVAVTLRIKVTPKDGAVLIYTSRTGADPIRFNGPETTARVPVDGPKLYLQLISGAKTYEVQAAGFELP